MKKYFSIFAAMAFVLIVGVSCDRSTNPMYQDVITEAELDEWVREQGAYSITLATADSPSYLRFETDGTITVVDDPTTEAWHIYVIKNGYWNFGTASGTSAATLGITDNGKGANAFDNNKIAFADITTAEQTGGLGWKVDAKYDFDHYPDMPEMFLHCKQDQADMNYHLSSYYITPERDVVARKSSDEPYLFWGIELGYGIFVVYDSNGENAVKFFMLSQSYTGSFMSGATTITYTFKFQLAEADGTFLPEDE